MNWHKDNNMLLQLGLRSVTEPMTFHILPSLDLVSSDSMTGLEYQD